MKKHNLSHFWPKFQKNVQVGDSVIKKTKEYDLILIKKSTRQKILCKYDEWYYLTTQDILLMPEINFFNISIIAFFGG